MRILLVGNPNVGKSSLFSRLTGVQVICSNYPGTTVDYLCGRLNCFVGEAEVVDVPGVYSLKAQSDAEKVALDMITSGDLLINVVDATNLERNLYLTLELMEQKKPMIIALNMVDDARHRGIEIDAKKLEDILGVPVVKTVAVTGEGIRELVEKISSAKSPDVKWSEEERWSEVGKIVSSVQVLGYKKHTLIELLEDASIKPFSGIIIAFFVLFLVFQFVIGVGNFIVENIIDPFFYGLYLPLIKSIFGSLFPSGTFLHMLLIGEAEDLVESRGVLTTGIYIPFGMILPFVFLFYLALGLIEDVGYLPRISTLMDSFMHRIGLHGAAVVSFVLGMGCRVPGILATRVLESKNQRFISTALIVLSIPCLAQMAVVVSLLLPLGIYYLFLFYISLIVIYVFVGFVLYRLVGGDSPEILLEIPPYRRPNLRLLLDKTWIRVKQFLVEAVPYIILGVVAINLMYSAGIVSAIESLFGPLLSGLFSLPEEAAIAVIVGFLRKDAAVGMLAPIPMSPMQLTVASILLVTSLPCVAAMTTLLKEVGMKKFAAILLLSAAVTVLVGITLKAMLL